MSPCQHRGTESFPPSLTLLSCSKSTELADFCAFVVPCIWAGSFKQPSVTAKRYATFKMFCQKVLKATQISCACVLLALYYIHRLRSAYPSIRASIGSEVRLFTTALILANKFLDDNTFTNKVCAYMYIRIHYYTYNIYPLFFFLYSFSLLYIFFSPPSSLIHIQPPPKKILHQTNNNNNINYYDDLYI